MSVGNVTFRIATPGDAPELAAARWAFRAEAGETPLESETAFAVRYAAFLQDALGLDPGIFGTLTRRLTLPLRRQASCSPWPQPAERPGRHERVQEAVH